MKNLIYLFSTVLLFSTFACDDDEALKADVTDVALTIKANYNGATFMTEEVYTFGDMDIKFTKLDFYISDIVLLSAGSGEIELKDIEFVNLSFNINEPDKAEAGVTIEASSVDVGEYTGLRFGIGVPADLNRTKWTDYASGHPLRNDSHYWPGWNSFIFAKIEGQIDEDKNGEFESGFAFHTGSDEGYIEKAINESISLELDATKTISLAIDVKDLLKTTDIGCDADDDGYLDLTTDECNRIHSVDQVALVKEVMGNFHEAISMD